MQYLWKPVFYFTSLFMMALYMIFGAKNADYRSMNPVIMSLNVTAWPDPDPSEKSVGPVSSVFRKTHILILASTRTGSSFLGQVFNHHPDVFYLFEPLYHVEASIVGLQLDAVESLLRSLFNCDLLALERYIKPQPESHVTSRLFRRASSKALCSPPVCNLLSPSKLDMEENDCIKKCPLLNLTLASEVCRRYQYVVIKTVRMSNVNNVRALLEDSRLNLKVIQLVRDPRGILSSRINTFGYNRKLLSIWQKTGQRPKNLDMTQIIETCNEFFTSVSTGLQQFSWLKEKYMVVRFEDLALRPIQKVKEMFNHTGMLANSNVINWLNTTIQGGSKWLVNRKYGTVRNSTAKSEDWRLKLPYDIVKYTQTLCFRTLQQLGYRTVNSDNELKNMSLTLIENIHFSI